MLHHTTPSALASNALLTSRSIPGHCRQLPPFQSNSPLQQQSPFRLRDPASNIQHHVRRVSASRIWNPSNSTPRFELQSPPRRRRPSTPTAPPIPISHPALDVSLPSINLGGAVAVAGETPLLTLSEQTYGGPDFGGPQNSLQISGDRISLPRSVRHSYEEKRKSKGTLTPSPTFPEEPEAGPSTVQPQAVQEADTSHRPTPRLRRRDERINPQLAVTIMSTEPSSQNLDKGKGKAIMTIPDDVSQKQSGASFDRDLERGPDSHERRDSIGSGIGSAISSSSNSSIMGDPDGQADDEEWGPQHPCFPHLNPHVPVDSPEYVNTRIIRIKRDWLVEGDLAPTFSNMYPEILDPAGLSEVEFRRVIDKLNSELVPIFSPYSARNVMDGVFGLLTGWLWEDLGLTGAKARLARLERWIERWNKEMEKTVGGDDNFMPPKIIPLRQTAYMTLDIQIFDPEILPAPSTRATDSRGDDGMPAEPPATVTAS
ncbi:Ras modification protein ERF4 [Cytospora mali]|uniref:Ras modification protein ERF4 n=1 Tax=Cytospora mali TaxID=578113 RepID=A0A194VLJ0_CYTMA|nr:Ras modification protein ERF4 [Valsa mali]